MHWSKSTLDQYNRYANRYFEYCVSQNVDFPSASEEVISSFLCIVGSGSPRPKSVLNGTLAALVCLFNAVGAPQTMANGLLQKLVDGIIKSCTVAPMLQTPVMPIDAFHSLFQKWPEDKDLAIKDLRMKAICLLAIVFMLRPSDIAPHARHLDTDTLTPVNMTFTRDQVKFGDSGDMSLTFHGIKNDIARDGFTITVSQGTDPKVDPVFALKEYMARTQDIRDKILGQPVFVTLYKPYHALGASSISRVLQDAIEAAGLGGLGFSAKCFRPTGATKAIASGLKPDTARHIGRWASPEVFEKHYVHTKVPATYVDTILG